MKQLLLLLFFFPVLLQAQEEIPFNKLIKETNQYLKQYSRLPDFEDEYFSILSFGFSPKEQEDLIISASNNNDYEEQLSENKDSVNSRFMIYYLQEKIKDRINQIVNHSDFQSRNIEELITSEELSIVVSEDKKLFNFSFAEKTGGTYRSKISIMHYTDIDHKNSADDQEFQSFFSSDGYTGIYAINAEEGTKYVLTNQTRFCSLCFESSVRLISFQDDQFKEDFVHSISNRNWDGGVTYDPSKQVINVDYFLDDLTSNCNCSQKEKFEWTENEPTMFSYNCCYSFVFVGNNFKKVDGEIKKTIDKEQDVKEVLSFKIKENNKEVKLLIDNKQSLFYAFLKPNGQVEFSFPVKFDENNIAFKISQKRDMLTFNNGNIIYQVYEKENKSGNKNIGILVKIGEKTYDLIGDILSLKGSLSNISIGEVQNISEE